MTELLPADVGSVVGGVMLVGVFMPDINQLIGHYGSPVCSTP